jgi:quercetin dioxygenase-like cupin family protein
VRPWRALASTVLVVACTTVASDPPPAQATRVAFSHSLPELDASRLRVSVVEVAYAPGGSSSPHSHPCPVIGYVVQGTLRMQVRGEPEANYRAGEAFYEAPNGTHLVSANASERKPAKLIAFFVCDGDQPHSRAPPEAKARPGRTP